MAKIQLINKKGEKLKDITLADNVWNVEANDIVLKKAIDLQLAATRQGTAKTITRSEVSGGGRKPWRQKGTGRARQGSIRATQWRGGGISGGVTPRDYTFQINKKERALALKSALSYKYQANELVVVDNISLDDLKTKTVKDIISTLKLNGKVLFVTGEENENLYLATRNLGYVYNIQANEINCYDLINADVVVCDEKAIEVIEGGLK